MSSLKKLSVVGLGKLGACVAATFASRGFEVVGIDQDLNTVEKITAGRAPVEEPHLAETLEQCAGRLRATTDPSEAVATEATFFIVPTPSRPDGSFANDFLLRALGSVAAAIAAAGKKDHLFVCCSTTTPGTLTREVIPFLEAKLGGVCGRDFGFCYNPEFIALGAAVHGLLRPDLVLIGESDPRSGDRLAELYERFNTNRPKVARMSLTSAELAKISINSFITAKISFTNQLRLIAGEYADTDIHAILDAIGSDSRIGNKYLKPGLSFGGPCLPRDNRLLVFTAQQVGLSAPLAEATDAVNELTKQRLAERVKGLVERGDPVGILGMAYRPDTSIVTESAGLHLANALKGHGCRVIVHDQGATAANCPELNQFEIAAAPESLFAIPNLKVVIIACPNPLYRELDFPPGLQIIDPWGLLND